MVRKKKVIKKVSINKYRDSVKLQEENREHFGMPTKIARAYEVVHDALILSERGEKQVHPPKKLIRDYLYVHNHIADEKDGSKNFMALKVGLMFERPLDNLTSLLTGRQVVSSDRKEALENAINAVQPYYPITRRNEVKEETAKTRTASKKKTTAKAATKKKVTAKGGTRVSKKKVVVAKKKDESPKTRGRKPIELTTYSGATVETSCLEEKVFSYGKEVSWEAFDEALKKGRVTPSTTVGYKVNDESELVNIIKTIGKNRGKSVAAKNVVSFVVDKFQFSEKVARRRLYTLINNGQLDIV